MTNHSILDEAVRRTRRGAWSYSYYFGHDGVHLIIFKNDEMIRAEYHRLLEQST